MRIRTNAVVTQVLDGRSDRLRERLPRGLVFLGDGESGGIAPTPDGHADLGAVVEQSAERREIHKRLVGLRGVGVEQLAFGKGGDYMSYSGSLIFRDGAGMPLVIVDSQARAYRRYSCRSTGDMHLELGK